MVRGAALVLGLIAVGCGYSNPQFNRVPPPSMTDDPKLVMTCDFPGLGRISSEVHLECRAVENNFWAGAEILARHNILGVPDYGKVFTNLEIKVLEGGCVDAGCAIIGEYHPDPDHPWAEVAFHMSPLLHEMLHHLDHLRNEPTNNHQNWDVKGYWASDDEFRATMVPVSRPL